MIANGQFAQTRPRVPAVIVEHDIGGAVEVYAILGYDCPMSLAMNGSIWIDRDHIAQRFACGHHAQRMVLVNSSDILGLWVPLCWS